MFFNYVLTSYVQLILCRYTIGGFLGLFIVVVTELLVNMCKSSPNMSLIHACSQA